MNTLFRLFSIICLVCISVVSYAQKTLSAVGLLNFPDSIKMNDTISFDIVIANDDTLTNFSGNIKIQFITDYMDSLGLSDTSMYSVTNAIQSGKLDTIHISGFYVTPSQFKAGDNAILIWPKTNLFGVGDTITHNITVLSTTGIIENQKKHNDILLYPNPFTNTINLFIKNNEDKGIEKVRIYDVLGNVKYESIYNNSKIDTDNLPQGIYILEIRLNNDEIIVKKIVKK